MKKKFSNEDQIKKYQGIDGDAVVDCVETKLCSGFILYEGAEYYSQLLLSSNPDRQESLAINSELPLMVASSDYSLNYPVPVRIVEIEDGVPVVELTLKGAESETYIH